MSKPHKRLVAWQKSMDLVEEIYELTKGFPREEDLRSNLTITSSRDFSPVQHRRRCSGTIINTICPRHD
jgi:hypothetical protein